MSNSGAVFRNLMGHRMRTANIVVLFYIAACAVTLGFLWHDGYEADGGLALTLGFAFMAGCVLFVLLAIDQEHVWVGSRYRLAPISELRLYILNLLATCLTFIYGSLYGAVVVGLTAMPYWRHARSLPHLVSYSVAIAVLLGSVILYMWVFTSLVHLVGSTISTFLPAMRQRIVSFIFYLLVLVIILMVLDGLEKGLAQFAPHIGIHVDRWSQVKNALPSFYLGSGTLLLQSVIYSAINVLMLHKWVETKQA